MPPSFFFFHPPMLLSLPFNSVHINIVLGESLMVVIFYLIDSPMLLYDLMTVSYYCCVGKWQAGQYNEANMPCYWIVQVIVLFWALHYHFEWAFSFRVLTLLIQSKGLLRCSSSHFNQCINCILCYNEQSVQLKFSAF